MGWYPRRPHLALCRPVRVGNSCEERSHLGSRQALARTFRSLSLTLYISLSLPRPLVRSPYLSRSLSRPLFRFRALARSLNRIGPLQALAEAEAQEAQDGATRDPFRTHAAYLSPPGPQRGGRMHASKNGSSQGQHLALTGSSSMHFAATHGGASTLAFSAARASAGHVEVRLV